MMKPKLLISACLCGKNTKYNGKNNLIPQIEQLEGLYDFVLICPEVMGGLPIPRDPSEIKGDLVLSKTGTDVTQNFILGAQKALELVKKHQVQVALLKESSPSCGVHMIYNGNFNGEKISGSGITTQVLKENGVKVYSEDEIQLLLNQNS